MRKETQKPIYITLLIIFAITFYLLRNNVYIIDDLIYHFFDRPFALIREYYYGTWLMPVQNITMYLLPYKLGINFQDWAFICGTTIKAITITFMMFCFLKTFLTEKISKIKACALTLFSFILLFCLLGQKYFVDFIIMSGFFRFMIPSSLLVCSLYLMFKYFLGHKTNLFVLFPVCFITAWSSEIPAVIMLVCAFVLLIYQKTKVNNRKELLPFLFLLLSVTAGTLLLVCSSGFNFHVADKLGSQAVSFSAVSSNLSGFTKAFISSLIIKYSVLWLIALLLFSYNIKKGETKYNLFGFSTILGVFIFGSALIVMGKTNYDGGFWIEHKDIYSVFIPALLYSLSVLALPFLKNNIETKWFKTSFISLFIVSLIFFLYYANKLDNDLLAIKEHTYLRDKIRLFYYYKGQQPIYPMSTHIRLADKHLLPMKSQNNKSDKYFDDNFIKENSDGYLTMDKYYYPLNYKIKIEETSAPIFLSHKDGLKTFLENGGNIDEITTRKYHFKDLKNQ